VIGVLALIIGFSIFVRLRLADLPLERDEGEYAYAGQLMLQGIPPYKLAYNMKLPGTYAAYAVIMAFFGQTTRGIHAGLIIVNTATILLIYFLGRRLFGRTCGLVAAASFALLSLSDSVLGLSAHATHFVTLFGIAGSLALVEALSREDRRLLFVSGLLFGLSVLMKQHAVFFVFFAGAMLLIDSWQQRQLRLGRIIKTEGILIAGAALPFILTCCWLEVAGVFPNFWFWTITYASRYASSLSLAEGFGGLAWQGARILQSAPILWVTFFVTLVCFAIAKRGHRSAIFLYALLLAAFASVCPGFYFRRHYFIPLLPAVGLVIGAGFQVMVDSEHGLLARRWLRISAYALLFLAFAQLIYKHSALFFRLTPETATRFLYGPNPFPEAIKIAEYIRQHSKPEDRVAVLGSEPEIYFYSHRHSATGYIYTYPLMEPQPYAVAMQKKMIADIEAARPEIVVLVQIPTSWGQRKESPTEIFDWEKKYFARELDPVGLIEMESAEKTVYQWQSNKRDFKAPDTELMVVVLKRKVQNHD